MNLFVPKAVMAPSAVVMNIRSGFPLLLDPVPHFQYLGSAKSYYI
jgi:hypothetical protein